MAKKVLTLIKLQIPGGQANPAPPVGPALGQHGVNIGQFVTQFNDKTKDMKGITVPVVITVYSDRSFTFITKTPPASVLRQTCFTVMSGSPSHCLICSAHGSNSSLAGDGAAGALRSEDR